MNNEIEKYGNASIISKDNQVPISFDKPIETFIGNAKEVHAETINHYEFVSYSGIPGMPTMSVPQQTVFNHDCYNLLVYGDECFFGADDSRNHVTLRKSTCLESASTDSEIRQKYASLSAEAIAEIKTFPALIAYENKQYGRTTDDHYACFGQITDIKNRSNGIEIYFHPIHAFKQQPLNGLLFELDLKKSNNYNELNHSHWTIKQIDLIEVLRENGLLRSY